MLHLKHPRLEKKRARKMGHCPMHGKPSLSPRVIPHSIMPVGIQLKTTAPVKKMTAMKTVTTRISLSTDSVLEPSVCVL